MTERARIALDAMGGDHAPRETVRGAVAAVEKDPALTVTLVGDQARIEAELASAETSLALRSQLPILHASQVVEGGDAPTDAVRKLDSSIRRASELVVSGQVDGLVAAGNTGAAVAAATVIVKLLPSVRRPGIGVTLPTADGHVVLCDAGANIHCKPLHLYHYGIMASQYARTLLGREKPRVGLLNIGSEEGKGTELLRETASLFASSKLNFVGNVEGNDVFTGKCDVIVCEGFAGNVVLKTAEGLYEIIEAKLKLLCAPVLSAGGATAAAFVDVLRRFRTDMDYAEYGGAPLLGLNGLVLISHGRSDSRAIRNALFQAARLHRGQVLRRMASDVLAAGEGVQ